MVKKKAFNPGCIVCIVLCLTLALALPAACAPGAAGTTTGAPAEQTEARQAETAAAGDAKNEADTTAAATAAATAATTAAAAAGEPSDELYTIKMLTGATKFTTSDLTKVGKYIQDNFNIVFENIPYTGDIREKQNLMLAAGDYGEIQYMQRDDIVTSYINAGALLDLDQFKDIMPNFLARYGEVQIPYWRLVGNGKLYKWEANVPLEGDMDIEANDIAIRTDVLERYGWPNPLSTGEWIKFLKQAIADFPEIDGQPTVGITSCFAEPWGLQGTGPILYEKSDSYLPLSNEGFTYNVKTGRFEDYFKNKYVKESLKFFNDLYREGLLDEESFTDTYDRTTEKMTTGVALSVWYAGWVDNSIIAATAPERQYIFLPVQSDTMVSEGQKRLIRKETTRNFDSYGITKNAKHPERIAALVDWAMSDEGQIILRSGIEGVHWERDASGKRVLTEYRKKAALEKDPDWNLTEGIGQYSFLGRFNIKAPDGQFHDLFAHAEINDEFGLSARQKEAYAGLGWANSKDWYIKNLVFGYTGFAGAVYIDSATDLGKLHQKMTEVRLKWSASMIMAKDDAEFENIYQQAMDDYDKLDHESVINEYNRLLDEATAALN